MLHPHEQYGRDVIAMMGSLRDALSDCGGNLDIYQLMPMSLRDVILLLASNGVRFQHSPEERIIPHNPKEWPSF